MTNPCKVSQDFVTVARSPRRPKSFRRILLQPGATRHHSRSAVIDRLGLVTVHTPCRYAGQKPRCRIGSAYAESAWFVGPPIAIRRDYPRHGSRAPGGMDDPRSPSRPPAAAQPRTRSRPRHGRLRPPRPQPASGSSIRSAAPVGSATSAAVPKTPAGCAASSPYCPGTARPRRRQHHDDLHARPEPRRPRGAQSGGFAVTAQRWCGPSGARSPQRSRDPRLITSS